MLSKNNGCVVARSVPNGVLWVQIHERLPDAVPFSSNYALYADFSRHAMERQETITPDVELYSIDEAFLSLPAAPSDRWGVLAAGPPHPSRFLMVVEGEASAPVRLGGGDLLVVECAAIPRAGQTVSMANDEQFALVAWTAPAPGDTPAPRLFGVVTHVLARPA